MSTLRFDGQGAGLGQRRGGDANDPCSYTLICRCGFDLGPLARFMLQPSGIRAARCQICDSVTIVHGASIVRVEHGKVIDAEIAASIQRYRDHLAECPTRSGARWGGEQKAVGCMECEKAQKALDSIDRKKRNEGRFVSLT